MISEVAYKLYLTITGLWWWEVDTQREKLSRTSLLAVSLLTVVLVLWNKRVKSTPLPPGPYGLPVVGYLPFLGSNLHEIFTQMAHKYGPIFSLKLGSKLHVVVNSMDLVKVVGRELDHTFANRSPPVSALVISYGGSNIAWSNNNAQLRDLRKILGSQALSNKNLNANRTFRTAEVRRTLNQVYTNIGKKINLNKIVYKTEVNVVTSMLWGNSKLDSSEGEYSSYIGDGFQEVELKITELLGAPNISDFLPLLSWFDLQGRKRDMQRQWEFVDQIFDSVIKGKIERKMKGELADEDTRKDLLQILLEIKEQKDAPTPLSMIQIKGLLMDILTAATDTTSTMVEWVMAETLHNPVVMRKVQDELAEVVGMNNVVEESHLPKLKYLDAVIKETFRLHTPLPLLIHRCPDESCKVAGYTVPKGTIVYMNVWAIHRDPNNWNDPLEFNPERFLNGNWDYKGNNLKFLPFGLGRRICPGIPLGEKMLTYILASFMHSFDWSLPKDEEYELSDVFGIVTRKRKPLVAIPSQRLSDASLYTYTG